MTDTEQDNVDYDEMRKMENMAETKVVMFVTPTITHSRIDLPQLPFANFACDMHCAPSEAARAESEHDSFLRTLTARNPPLPRLYRVLRKLEPCLIRAYTKEETQRHHECQSAKTAHKEGTVGMMMMPLTDLECR